MLITEDYPLPGEDFYSEEQLNRVKAAHNLFDDKLVVLALRSDYELAHFPDLNTYICTYSSRAASAKALAKSLIYPPN